MQSYASDTLYHLVGWRHPEDDNENLQTLIKILDAMEIRSNSVDGRSGGMLVRVDPRRPLTNGEPIEQTITCFCDLPLQSLGLHIAKYGRLGVGVDRAVLASCGARPVIYIPKAPRSASSLVNSFAQEARQVLADLKRHFPASEETTTRSRIAGSASESPEEAVDAAESLIQRDFLAFLKVFNVDLPDNHPENYYMEREWRKFGHLNLRMSLRHIVAPMALHDKLRSRFPALSQVPILDAQVAPSLQRDASKLALDEQNRAMGRTPYHLEGL